MHLNVMHLVGLLISLTLAVSVSIWAGRSVKTADDYSVGGRSAGVLMIVGSVLGIIVGGTTIAGSAQAAFVSGFSAWTFTLGLSIGLFMMTFGYIQRVRRYKVTTVPEILVLHYGKYAGVVSSVASIIGLFFSLISNMLITIYIFMLVFEIQSLYTLPLIIISLGLLMYAGGINAAGMAGLLKLFLIMISVWVAGGLAFADMGYLSGMQLLFPDPDRLTVFLGSKAEILGGVISLAVGILAAQTYAQLVFSAVSTRAAVLGVFIAACITVPIGLPCIMVGMFMSVHHPEIAPAMALPLYMLKYLPDWLGGVGIAAILLSCFGSIGGTVLGMSTIFANDIYKNLSKQADSKSLLAANRLSLMLFITLASIFSYLNMESLMFFWNYLSMNLRGSGIFFPYMFALFVSRRVKMNYGIAAMLVSTLVALGLSTVYMSMSHTLFPAMLVSLFICLIGLQRN